MRRLEQRIDPDTLVGDLRIGQQQIVEIAKALLGDVRVLIMDEPMSALSSVEVEILFRVIAELKAAGVAIVYISHRLDEIVRIGDYVTVLRDGRIQARAAIAALGLPVRTPMANESRPAFQRQAMRCSQHVSRSRHPY